MHNNGLISDMSERVHGEMREHLDIQFAKYGLWAGHFNPLFKAGE